MFATTNAAEPSLGLLSTVMMFESVRQRLSAGIKQMKMKRYGSSNACSFGVEASSRVSGFVTKNDESVNSSETIVTATKQTENTPDASSS